MNPTPPPLPPRRRWLQQVLEHWWVLPVGATFGAFAWMFNYAARITLNRSKPQTPQYVASPPQDIAALADFGRDYQSMMFTYRSQNASTPCIALRIPQATASSLQVDGRHYVAFSRICTHLGCSVLPLQDPELTAISYNYRPEHPVLGCPCHFSVFDPMQEGSSVIGKALYPLPRVKLQAKAGRLYAIGLEPAPKI